MGSELPGSGARQRRSTVTVRWGDYEQAEIEGEDGKPLASLAAASARGDGQRPARRSRRIPSCSTCPTPAASQLHVVERLVAAEELDGAASRGHALGLGLPREPPHAGRGAARTSAYVFQAELEVRCDRAVRAAAGPARRARRRVGRAGGRSPLRGHAGVRDRPRRLGRMGDRRRRVPRAPHGLDPERRGGEDGDRGRAGRRAVDGGARGARRWRRGRRRSAAARGRSTATGSRRSARASRRCPGTRRETAEELLRLRGLAADRIERGIGVLASDADALDAFRVANRAVARALRKRLEHRRRRRWRAFQLAFLLLNLPGLADPTRPRPRDGGPALLPDRRRQDRGVPRPRGVRDGAAAAAPPGRRRARGRGRERHHALHAAAAHARPARAAPRGSSARSSWSARRTPRATATWPFEIGLWVGKAATPNGLGTQGRRPLGLGAHQGAAVQERPEGQAVADPARELPVVRHALRARLVRAPARTTTSRASCGSSARTSSATSRATAPLPIVAVDEPIYRRLPGFLIATVDKFASLPWVGQVGRAARRRGPARRDGLLRRRGAGQGHAPRGAAPAARPRHPGRAAPHLRAARHDGRPLRGGDRGALRARDRRPRGAAQDRRLDRHGAPGAGPDPGALRAAAHAGVPAAGPGPARLVLRPDGARRRRSPARLYLGVAAQGRNPKVVMRKAWLALMGAAERCLPRRRRAQERREPRRPVHDAARLLQQPARAGRRAADPRGGGPEHDQGLRRAASAIGETTGLFQDRKTFSEVVELTSRVSTDKVAEARRRLELPLPRDRAARRLRHRDQHDLGRPRHPAARADGRPRPAEDARRVHPGDEPRRPRRRAARASS